MSKPVLGIVCGMQTEFDMLERWPLDPRVEVAVSGARPSLAADGARWLLDEGCRVLLSWGVAGGLDPDLPSGDVLVPDAVITPSGSRYETMETSAVDDNPGRGAILGSDDMVLGAEGKADLFARTGAVAVDMESHAMMAVAAEAGAQGLVIRAIGDGAGSSLPPFVSGAISETGHPLIGPILLGLLTAPGRLPALLRLKSETDRALRRLQSLTDEGLFDRLLAEIETG
ncbi:MAG: hypothetical protein AAF317_03120 [Pseudomonadota bacterium]